MVSEITGKKPIFKINHKARDWRVTTVVIKASGPSLLGKRLDHGIRYRLKSEIINLAFKVFIN